MKIEVSSDVYKDKEEYLVYEKKFIFNDEG